MKITTTEKTTTIECDARELRESNTLAGNVANFLSRLFQSSEPLEDDDKEEEQEEE